MSKAISLVIIALILNTICYNGKGNLQEKENDLSQSSSLSFLKPSPYGQHLSLDLSGIKSFDMIVNNKNIHEATIKIVKFVGMELSDDIRIYKLSHPKGVSAFAMLKGGGYLTIQTSWQEKQSDTRVQDGSIGTGRAVIDVSTRNVLVNFKAIIGKMVAQFGDVLSIKTVFSIVPRGKEDDANIGSSSMVTGADNKNEDDTGDEDGADAEEHHEEEYFQPYELMSEHKYKKKVFEKQSKYQHVAIWDHIDFSSIDDSSIDATRSLFLDGVIQSNVHDEEVYHESLVHPAFIASSEPPKRVLIIGGGEGATLRETLKWSSVERVTMVDLDEEVIKASRTYLPSYNNCTGFGSNNCFDDGRLNLYTEDFFAWFEREIGNDICEKQQNIINKERAVKGDNINSDKGNRLLVPYDIVIIDLLDTEELPMGEVWAEYLYSDLFFMRVACTVTPGSGVVVTNFGEAPDFLSGGPVDMEKQTKGEERLQAMFMKKIKQVHTMSKYFKNTRLYDTYIPAFRGLWTFAIGIVPKLSDDKADNDNTMRNGTKFVDDDKSTIGIRRFEADPVHIDSRLQQGLIRYAYPLAYYSGSVQHGFQYATADWMGIFCEDPIIRKLCDVPKNLRVEVAKQNLCDEFDAFNDEIISRNPPAKICGNNDLYSDNGITMEQILASM